MFTDFLIMLLMWLRYDIPGGLQKSKPLPNEKNRIKSYVNEIRFIRQLKV